MAANVFTIPPGAPFLATFVRALLDGRILSGLDAADPLALARLAIYVPTQRAGRALAVEFSKALPGPSALLPRIRPLGALEDDDGLSFSPDAAREFDTLLAPAASEIERRLTLGELTLTFARALKHAVISIGDDGEPVFDQREALLVSPTPANACALARELGALIDEFIIEDVAEGAIENVVDDAFDRYWAITRKFLEIALTQWPAVLEQRGLVDAARRQKALIAAQIANLQQASDAPPVVALGSTGSNPTTARLLGAIAHLPQGAVVLPGLDLALDDIGWRHIGAALGEHGEPAFTHPQAMLKRTLSIMRVAREDVREIGAPSPALEARRALVSQALRPADSADQWRIWRAGAASGFEAALQGVTLVEAPDERFEALTLALYMREALDTPGRSAALITPDRNVARRVAAELARFAIEIDNSGGRALALAPIGTLARALAEIAHEGASAVAVASLLAHPLAAFGLPREEVARRAGWIEIAVLRAVPADGDKWSARISDARALTKETHAHPAAKRLADEDWPAIEDLLQRLDAALAPLLAAPRTCALATRVSLLRTALEAVTDGKPSGALLDGAEEFLELLSEIEAASARLDFDAASFADFLDSLLFEVKIRKSARTHPRLKILGPLEARLIDADLLLLAGLDETIWPPQANSGAFLSRAMRAQLGLSPPERRIGQSAHDFTMALGAGDVVLSRALKRDGAPTVASRFLTRLAALSGDAFATCKRRGDAMLDIAGALDRPSSVAACARPEPRPPVELRPKQLSVTRIETLRRDPYAVYAERILRLQPLEPLGAEFGARELGTAVHAAIEDFVRAHPHGPLPDDARETLLDLAREKLAIFLHDPSFRAFKWPRVEAGLDNALQFEAKRRALGARIYIEQSGAWDLRLFDGTTFRLTARADRIEVDASGRASIFDYKTGRPPSLSQVRVGFAPQLTLEAAMLEAGGFRDICKEPGGIEAVEAGYLQIGGGGKDGEPIWIEGKDLDFRELVDEHAAQLRILLDQFRQQQRSYPSRPYVALTSHESGYDHLARVKEWMREEGREER